MHDFDAERKKRHSERLEAFGDCQFTLAGRTLRYLPNAPYHVVTAIAGVAEAEGIQVYGEMEKIVISLIAPEDRDTYSEIVSNGSDDPVTVEDLVALFDFLVGAAAGRPPTQPESSASGQQGPGTNSTDTSSTPPDAA